MSDLATTAAIPKTPRQLDKARRERDAARKRAQRDAARLAGVPRIGHVDAAITEAISFAFMAGKLDAAVPSQQWFPVNMCVIMAVAEDVLVARHHYDREQSKKAIRDKLARRPEHQGVDYVPTVKVRPGEMGYRTAAPVAIAKFVHVLNRNTPVTSSGQVREGQRSTGE